MNFEISSIEFNSCGVEMEVKTPYRGDYSVGGSISLSYHKLYEGREWSINTESLVEYNEYLSLRMLEQLDEIVNYFNENVCVNLQEKTLIVNNPTFLEVGSNFKL